MSAGFWFSGILWRIRLQRWRSSARMVWLAFMFSLKHFIWCFGCIRMDDFGLWVTGSWWQLFRMSCFSEDKRERCFDVGEAVLSLCAVLREIQQSTKRIHRFLWMRWIGLGICYFGISEIGSTKLGVATFVGRLMPDSLQDDNRIDPPRCLLRLLRLAVSLKALARCIVS